MAPAREAHELIENLLHEGRRFPPPPEFAARSNAQATMYSTAAASPELYWAQQATELLDWHRPFSRTLDWSNPPFAKWFADGRINASVNCLDRHVAAGNGDRPAILWEGEPGDSRTISYAQLTTEVKKAANLLTSLGIREGDRVAIYLPMIPEAVIAMLAVARIGAIHSVIFGGFSAESLRQRLDDAEASLVITADGGYRRGRASALKPAVDGALRGQRTVKRVLVVKRTGQEIDWVDGRDLWWHDEIAQVSDEHEARGFAAENPLFILYTSGTTGTPKGILHTTGGYLVQAAYTHRHVFDIKPETDVYWCTADVGWITGHTYVAYGPLANGATQVLYEGTPEAPEPGRWWQIIEKYGVTILYTAPTAIRSFMKQGRQIPSGYDLGSLRLLGSVGEPINPEAWMWYHTVIGGSRCPIVDTWWQTETGGIMMSPLPGVTTLKPGSAQDPLPGISLDVVDELGESEPRDSGGYLVATRPWPGMLRGIWKDPARFIETYWSQFGNRYLYFAGDGARRDRDGDIWLLGRVDDVMNVSGHRLSTAEIESALVAHPFVAEAAVVGASDETTGQAVIAFVILKQSQRDEAGSEENVAAVLRSWVAEQIGPIAKPRQIMVVPELPKTRSGKIMRRLLRDVAEERPVGDITTLADTSVMEVITGKLAGGATED